MHLSLVMLNKVRRCSTQAVPVRERVSRSVWFHLVRTAARFVKYSPTEIPSEQDLFENFTSAQSFLLNKQAPIVKKCVCTQKQPLFGADFQGRTCQNIKDLVPSNSIFWIGELLILFNLQNDVLKPIIRLLFLSVQTFKFVFVDCSFFGLH